MSLQLPIPSKSALRTLRRLALGTSCSVAFGAGVVSEDRRRRIRSAREVHDNGRRIKTSRKYHSSGTSVATRFDDDSVPPDLMLWTRRRDVFRSKTPDKVTGPHLEPVVKPISHPDHPSQRYTTSRRSDLQKYRGEKGKFDMLRLDDHPHEPLTNEIFKTLYHNGQEDEVERARDAIQRLSNIVTTSSDSAVIQAYLMILQYCKARNQLSLCVPLLQEILRSPLKEDGFYKLQPEVIITHLARPSAVTKETAELASSIFLTNLTTKPGLMPDTMRIAGTRLLRATASLNLHAFTADIFWRLTAGRGNNPVVGLHYLMRAESDQGRHRDVISHFLRFFGQTRQKQSSLYAVAGLAFDSAIVTGRLAKAERILMLASQVASSSGLVTSTSWIMTLLRCHWDRAHDYDEIRPLCSRLEEIVGYASHPQAFYAMIHDYASKCGRSEDAARFKERIDSLGSGTRDAVYQVALSRAKSNDWSGVRDAMSEMRAASTELSPVLFLSILKCYATLHSPMESERFLGNYLAQFAIKVDDSLVVFLVKEYAAAGDFDGMQRWLGSVQASGYVVSAAVVNAILRVCKDELGMSLSQLLHISKQVRSIGGQAMLNADTAQILRGGVKRPQVRSSMDLEKRSQRFRDIQKITAVCALPMDLCDEMRKALASRKPELVLQKYEECCLSGVVTPQTVSLAAEATLMMSRDEVATTVKLLASAKARGIDISSATAPLVMHQIDQIARHSNTIRPFEKLIGLLKQNELSIAKPALTHAVHLLTRKGYHREAIHLWTSLAKPEDTDIVSLHVMLKAYIALFDCLGIQWVMKTLCQKGLHPDNDFKLLIKNARTTTRKYLAVHNDDLAVQTYMKVLDAAMKVVLESRSIRREKQRLAESKTLEIMEAVTMVSREEQAKEEDVCTSNVVGRDHLNIDNSSESTAIKRSRQIASRISLGCREQESGYLREPGMSVSQVRLLAS